MATAADIVAVARSQIGVRESPRGSNRQPYGAALRANGLPWCAVFVTWVYLRCGIDLRKFSDNAFYTPNLFGDLAARGWQVAERNAGPGDIVFYDFPGHKSRIEHVGIVVENHYPNFVCVEGNTSGSSNSNGGMVMQRGRNAGQIVGVIHAPGLARVQAEPPKNPPPPPTPAAIGGNDLVQVAAALAFCKLAVVGVGHVVEGPAVRFVQTGINALRIPGLLLAVDGQFGIATADAVRWVQATHGLVADGQVGPATWHLLFP